MENLSLHILDCAENSIRAGATHISITVEENKNENTLSISIEDNGKGMSNAILKKAQDPFFSTKSEKRIGLGISLLAQATRETEGSFRIISTPGEGTRVNALFTHDHPDRQPLGSMADTIIALIICGSGSVDIRYRHVYNSRNFEFDTTTIRNDLQDISITEPAVLADLKDQIENALKEIRRI